MLALRRIILFVFLGPCSSIPPLEASQGSQLLEQARSGIQDRSNPLGQSKALLYKDSGLGTSVEDAKAYLKALADPYEDVRLKRLALEGLQGCNSQDCLKEIAKSAEDPQAYNEFSFRLYYDRGTIPGDDSHWLALMKNGDPLVEQMAIEMLSDSMLQSSVFEELLVKKAINEKNGYYLRQACMKQLIASSSSKIFPLLVEMLKDKSSSSYALELLQEATGLKYGANVPKWQSWLKNNPEFTADASSLKTGSTPLIDRFEQPRKNDYRDRYGNVTEQDQVGSAIMVPYVAFSKVRKKKSLYGIPIEGKNLLFFLDCSGSMNKRFHLLKKEMKYMAQTLGDSHFIGVVFFPFANTKDSILEFSKNNGAFRGKLSRFLDKKSPNGPTPLYLVMKMYYEQFMNAYEPVDTIYVISDGQIGSEHERANIYALNSKLRIRINTICIQGSPAFLNGVAADNLGKSFLVR